MSANTNKPELETAKALLTQFYLRPYQNEVQFVPDLPNIQQKPEPTQKEGTFSLANISTLIHDFKEKVIKSEKEVPSDADQKKLIHDIIVYGLPAEAKFSVFVNWELATEVYKILFEIENSKGFLKAIEIATEVARYEDVNKELLHYAVTVFLAHAQSDVGKKLLPNVMAFHSNKFFPQRIHHHAAHHDQPNGHPSKKLGATNADFPTKGAEKSPRFITGSVFDPDALVSFWREDPWLNSHHWHWHIVYPGGGAPDSKDKTKMVPKDRQGELFYFMHQQMIARYDAERIAMNIPRVQPLTNWREPIPEGYDAHLTNIYGSNQYTPRPSGTKLPEYIYSSENSLGVDGGKRVYLNDLELWRNRLYDAIDAGYFFHWEPENPHPTKGDSVGNISQYRVPMNINLLGFTLESNDFAVKKPDSEVKFYGNLHNQGHNMIANSTDPKAFTNSSSGVIGDLTTAVRDPVFFRWHKFIDDVYFRHLSQLTPYNFYFKDNGDLPPQNTREERLFVMYPVSVAVVGDLKTKTNELITQMRKIEVDLTKSGYSDDGKGAASNVTIASVNYLPFTYKFAFRNGNSTNNDVTFRVWICPSEENYMINRRNFILMDRFVMTNLPGNGNVTTIERKSVDSSVLQQAVLADDLFPMSDERKPLLDSNYCKCGVPQHMLLPRGRPGGMKFKLFVMATDWSIDKVDAESKPCCGSEYCGLVDKKYPDSRPLGYPFDRPWAGKKGKKAADSEDSFADMLSELNTEKNYNWNMSYDDITINYDINQEHKLPTTQNVVKLTF